MERRHVRGRELLSGEVGLVKMLEHVDATRVVIAHRKAESMLNDLPAITYV